MVRLAVVNPEDYCEVPAGPCVIGPTSTSDASAELRRRFQTATVTLPRFFIKRFPVTEREWNLAHGADSGGRLPATGMTYVEAVAFCKRRGTRLPNRFEWEKAARGEDGFEYPWGASFDADLLNGPLLWWGARTRVDQFPEGASPYGVMDMAGNVQELVRDRSVHGPEVLQRVRGGSFRSSSLEFSTWAGFDLAPGTEGGPTIGFRDVIEAHDAPVLPQGFVNVAAGKLRRPDGTWERWPSFDIARYAVSNLEYEEFVTATGAPRPSHWPFDFDDRYLPVVNVPVDAAKKFCEWKTARIHRRVRPLTPSIWRAAALVSGTGVQRFPWGADYVPYWCNARDSGWGGPVRVFEIADGRSPCGAFNLVGNVYEWCGNAHVIGGSWRSSCVTPDIVKAADGPKDDIGFRYWAEIHAEPRR
jgi:formylglycine-generating enzyme required for sulfatase activity